MHCNFLMKVGILQTIVQVNGLKPKLFLSPRVGFRWKVPDEKGLVLRGGTGIFTGKIPFVFLTNMPSNSGVYQTGAVLNTTAQLQVLHSILILMLMFLNFHQQ